MRWLLKRGGRLESSVDPRVIELQAAKEILAEIFRVRACDVEEMIGRRLEAAEKRSLIDEGPWPETFSVGR